SSSASSRPWLRGGCNGHDRRSGEPSPACGGGTGADVRMGACMAGRQECCRHGLLARERSPALGLGSLNSAGFGSRMAASFWANDGRTVADMKAEEYFLPGAPEPVIRGGAGQIVAKRKQQEPQELESNYERRNYGLGRVRDRQINEPAQHAARRHPADSGS